MADPAIGRTEFGMSRRDLIKASALAGAAAWTVPMIVDSLASPAAAESVALTSTGINCSKAILFFIVPGDSTIHIAGFQDIPDCQTCDCFGNWALPNLSGCASTFFRVSSTSRELVKALA